jgi:hypothetical protein
MSRSLSHSRSAYQVDVDRHSHLSCSSDRNSPAYSPYFGDYVDEDRHHHLSGSSDRNSPSYLSYFQDYVDREGGERSLCPLDTNGALVVPAKSTRTGTPPFLSARQEQSCLLLLFSRLRRQRRWRASSVSCQHKQRSCSAYQVDVDRHPSFPVLRTGKVLLTLPTLKIMLTEKVASVLSILSIETTLS